MAAAHPGVGDQNRLSEEEIQNILLSVPDSNKEKNKIGQDIKGRVETKDATAYFKNHMGKKKITKWVAGEPHLKTLGKGTITAKAKLIFAQMTANGFDNIAAYNEKATEALKLAAQDLLREKFLAAPQQPQPKAQGNAAPKEEAPEQPKEQDQKEIESAAEQQKFQAEQLQREQAEAEAAMKTAEKQQKELEAQLQQQQEAKAKVQAEQGAKTAAEQQTKAEAQQQEAANKAQAEQAGKAAQQQAAQQQAKRDQEQQEKKQKDADEAKAAENAKAQAEPPVTAAEIAEFVRLLKSKSADWDFVKHLRDFDPAKADEARGAEEKAGSNLKSLRELSFLSPFMAEAADIDTLLNASKTVPTHSAFTVLFKKYQGWVQNNALDTITTALNSGKPTPALTSIAHLKKASFTSLLRNAWLASLDRFTQAVKLIIADPANADLAERAKATLKRLDELKAADILKFKNNLVEISQATNLQDFNRALLELAKQGWWEGGKWAKEGTVVSPDVVTYFTDTFAQNFHDFLTAEDAANRNNNHAQSIFPVLNAALDKAKVTPEVWGLVEQQAALEARLASQIQASWRKHDSKPLRPLTPEQLRVAVQRVLQEGLTADPVQAQAAAAPEAEVKDENKPVNPKEAAAVEAALADLRDQFTDEHVQAQGPAFEALLTKVKDVLDTHGAALRLSDSPDLLANLGVRSEVTPINSIFARGSLLAFYDTYFQVITHAAEVRTEDKRRALPNIQPTLQRLQAAKMNRLESVKPIIAEVVGTKDLVALEAALNKLNTIFYWQLAKPVSLLALINKLEDFAPQLKGFLEAQVAQDPEFIASVQAVIERLPKDRQVAEEQAVAAAKAKADQEAEAERQRAGAEQERLRREQEKQRGPQPKQPSPPPSASLDEKTRLEDAVREEFSRHYPDVHIADSYIEEIAQSVKAGLAAQGPEEVKDARAAASPAVDGRESDAIKAAVSEFFHKIQRAEEAREIERDLKTAKDELAAARNTPEEEAKANALGQVYAHAKAAGLVKPIQPKPEEPVEKQKQGYFTKDHGKNSWRFLVLAGGLLLGGGLAVLWSYFAFPLAMAQVAAVLGLTGPLALIIPLLSIGVIGALLGAALLAFLEARLVRANSYNYIFMRNLALVFGSVASVALGLFIVAATPAVFSLLNVAAAGSATGTASAFAYALPFVLGGLISLTVVAVIGYVLYRTSGMRKNRWNYNVNAVMLSLILEQGQKTVQARQQEAEQNREAQAPEAALGNANSEKVPLLPPAPKPKEEEAASSNTRQALDLLQQGLERGYSPATLLGLFNEVAKLHSLGEDENALRRSLQDLQGDEDKVGLVDARANALQQVATYKSKLFPTDKPKSRKKSDSEMPEVGDGSPEGARKPVDPLKPGGRPPVRPQGGPDAAPGSSNTPRKGSKT